MKISIRTQLMVMMFVVSLLVLSMSIIYFIHEKTLDTRTDIENMSKATVSILVQDYLQATLLHLPDTAVDMARKIEAFPTISHAVLIDSNNVPVFNYQRKNTTRIDLVNLNSEFNVNNDSELNVITPIEYMGGYYGKAYFRYSLKSYNEQLHGFMDKLVIMIPIVILASLILAMYMQRYFTRPIFQLAENVDSFSRGRIKSIKKKEASSKEMQFLYDEFENMTSTINNAQIELTKQKEQLHTTLESIADGVIATDSNGYIEYMNPAAEKITGWSEYQAKHMEASHVYKIVHHETGEDLTSQIDETLLQGDVHICHDNTDLINIKKESIAIQSSIAPIFSDKVKINGAVIIFQDVEESREMARKLKHQATYDPLTEMLNRTEYERSLSAIVGSAQKNEAHALLYLDLDQFKVVNDTSGHAAGDALLIHVSQILRKHIRGSDLVARLGGDEFSIFLPNCSIDRAQGLSENIRKEIGDTIFSWEDRTFRLGVSIGVVPVSTPRMTYSELMRAADLSCYAAKDAGRNRVHVYRVEDEELIQRHGEMQWVSRIQNALDEDKFVLYAQHVVPTVTASGRAHTEVLIRYLDENGEISPPGAFLPAAERYNLIQDIDRWVIKKILTNEEFVGFLQANPNFSFNINLSGLTLSSTGLTDFVTELLQQANLRPRAICFEITETSAVANLSATAKFMRNMKLQGCEFALDDFGIGVSSFSYLKNLPVDYLKIDGSFIQDMHTNPVNAAMVSAINQVGHVMNIKTIAEFVSSPEVIKELESIGVDYLQGYHIHMPEPLSSALESLKKYDIKSASDY